MFPKAMGERLDLYVGSHVNVPLAAALLQDAQHALIDLCNPGFLDCLRTVETAKSLTSGYYDLTGLTSPIYMSAKGLIGIQPTGNNYPFSTKLSMLEYRKFTAASFIDLSSLFTVYDSRYYVKDTKVYFLPWQTGDTTTIDIWFTKRPTEITAATWETAVLSFDADLHGTIVDLACVNFPKSPLAVTRYQLALERINTLNIKHPTTGSWERSGIRGNRMQGYTQGYAVAGTVQGVIDGGDMNIQGRI